MQSAKRSGLSEVGWILVWIATVALAVLAMWTIGGGCRTLEDWLPIPPPEPVPGEPPAPDVPPAPADPVPDGPEAPSGPAEPADPGTAEFPSSGGMRTDVAVGRDCVAVAWDLPGDSGVGAAVRWPMGGWRAVKLDADPGGRRPANILTPRCAVAPEGCWVTAQFFKSGDLHTSGTAVWFVAPGKARGRWVAKVDVPETGWNRSEAFSAGDALLLLGNNGGAVTLTAAGQVRAAAGVPLGVSAEQHGYWVGKGIMAGMQAGGPGNPASFGIVRGAARVGPVAAGFDGAVQGDDFTHPSCAGTERYVWAACRWEQGLFVRVWDVKASTWCGPAVRLGDSRGMSRQGPPIVGLEGGEAVVGMWDGARWMGVRMQGAKTRGREDLGMRGEFLAIDWRDGLLYLAGSEGGRIVYREMPLAPARDPVTLLTPAEMRAGDELARRITARPEWQRNKNAAIALTLAGR